MNHVSGKKNPSKWHSAVMFQEIESDVKEWDKFGFVCYHMPFNNSVLHCSLFPINTFLSVGKQYEYFYVSAWSGLSDQNLLKT